VQAILCQSSGQSGLLSRTPRQSISAQHSVNGSFAEYAIGAAAYVGRLPAKPDFAALAPILCAGVTTYKGLKETEARQVSGWRFRASTVSATSPCSTRKRWACMSSRST
jgi:D-arabinose 1-dehydrogenase-like Zn-dependent alcohol dehydrogenase